MLGIVGIVVIFVMVFGGYLLAGGKFAIIIKALPFEFMMIGGAGIGAFLISNDMGGVKHTLKDLGKVFKGPKWKPDDYRDLLCLLFSLIRIARANPVEVEQHIEDPENLGLYEVNVIANYDADIIAHLNAPAGSHFARNEQGVFERIDFEAMDLE